MGEPKQATKTVHLSDQQHEDLRVMAFETRRSIQELVAEAVANLLVLYRRDKNDRKH